jgi:V/A-type H+/Na+-transporting ATPase subunit E
MENKLQELTDKLYKEGLSKGKEEGEAILADAKAKAEEIIKNAEAQAEAIVKKAGKEAEEYRTKVEGDVKMAAAQSIQATRKDIENLMVGKMTGKQVDSVLSSADFVKEIIKAVATKFNAEEAVDLNVVLPESLRKDLEPFVAGELATGLKGGVTAQFSKKVAGGFTIGPKDGSYFISLTDETFKTLISDYLRPATRKILFGE